jgi:hypothetical protein
MRAAQSKCYPEWIKKKGKKYIVSSRENVIRNERQCRCIFITREEQLEAGTDLASHSGQSPRSETKELDQPPGGGRNQVT